MPIIMKRMVEKISARVFCQREGQGGNPVTIFRVLGDQYDTAATTSKNRLSNKHHGDPSRAQRQPALAMSTQQALARQCLWESVVVHDDEYESSDGVYTQRPARMSFFLPTGESVSFCAHAAMGGCLALRTSATTSPNKSLLREDEQLDFVSTTDTSDGQNLSVYHATVHDHDVVSLQMESTWTLSPVPHVPSLRRILRDTFGLETDDLIGSNNNNNNSLNSERTVIHLINSNVSRPKTLVRVASVDILDRVPPPRSIAPVNDRFRRVCDALQSTGIYLYARVMDNDDTSDLQENPNEHMPKSSSSSSSSSSSQLAATSTLYARQFPRASGYAEDPATGIAAAALAISLEYESIWHDYWFHQFLRLSGDPTLNDQPNDFGIDWESSQSYRILQGQAMGQPSTILVQNIRWKDRKFPWDIDEFEAGANLETLPPRIPSTTRQADVSFCLLGKIHVDERTTIEVDDEVEEK